MSFNIYVSAQEIGYRRFLEYEGFVFQFNNGSDVFMFWGNSGYYAFNRAVGDDLLLLFQFPLIRLKMSSKGFEDEDEDEELEPDPRLERFE